MIGEYDPRKISDDSEYVITLKDGTKLDLAKFEKTIKRYSELFIYNPGTRSFDQKKEKLTFNLPKDISTIYEFVDYLDDTIDKIPQNNLTEKQFDKFANIQNLVSIFTKDFNYKTFEHGQLKGIHRKLRRLEQRIEYIDNPTSQKEIDAIKEEIANLEDEYHRALSYIQSNNKYSDEVPLLKEIRNTFTRLYRNPKLVDKGLQKEHQNAYNKLNKYLRKMHKAESKGSFKQREKFEKYLNEAEDLCDEYTDNELIESVYKQMVASYKALDKIETKGITFEKEGKTNKEYKVRKRNPIQKAQGIFKKIATSVKNTLGNIKALSSGKDNDDDYIDAPYEDVEEIDVEGATFDAGSNPDNSYDSFRHQQAENAEAARAEAGKPHAEPSPIDVHAEPVTGDDVKNPGGSGGSGDHR